MNLDAALALISAAAGSAATEAGRRAWDSLLALSRRLLGRGEAEDGAAGTPGEGAPSRAGEPAGEAGRAAPATDGPGASRALLTALTDPASPGSVAPQDAEGVRALAALLAERARGDARVAAELIRWGEAHRAALAAAAGTGQVTVHNTVSGNARIEGGLLQAGRITGDVTFGG